MAKIGATRKLKQTRFEIKGRFSQRQLIACLGALLYMSAAPKRKRNVKRFRLSTSIQFDFIRFAANRNKC